MTRFVQLPSGDFFNLDKIVSISRVPVGDDEVEYVELYVYDGGDEPFTLRDPADVAALTNYLHSIALPLAGAQQVTVAEELDRR